MSLPLLSSKALPFRALAAVGLLSLNGNPAAASPVTINFDALTPLTATADNGIVTGEPVAAYLAGYGITTSAPPTVINTTIQTFYSSPTTNVFNAANISGTVGQDTLTFSSPVDDFSFVRAGFLGANSSSGNTRGGWNARAFNSAGVSLGDVGESPIASFGNLAPQTFSLPEDNISYVTFVGDNQGFFGTTTPPITDLAFTPTCAGVVQNAISVTPANLVNGVVVPATAGNYMTAVFTPNFGLTLTQAAAVCGVQGFDWRQFITNLPNPSPFVQVSPPSTPLLAPPDFSDPAPLCGYTYEATMPPSGDAACPDTSFPFYCTFPVDPTGDCQTNSSDTSLSFADDAADPCLPGGSGAGCGGLTAAAGSALEFSTTLVGVNGGDLFELPVPVNFTWKSDFNGCAAPPPGAPPACISQTKGIFPLVPGSGTGGVTILTVNGEPVPEPPTLALLGFSLAGLLCARRMKKMSSTDDKQAR